MQSVPNSVWLIILGYCNVNCLKNLRIALKKKSSYTYHPKKLNLYITDILVLEVPFSVCKWKVCDLITAPRMSCVNKTSSDYVNSIKKRKNFQSELQLIFCVCSGTPGFHYSNVEYCTLFVTNRNIGSYRSITFVNSG